MLSSAVVAGENIVVAVRILEYPNDLLVSGLPAGDRL